MQHSLWIIEGSTNENRLIGQGFSPSDVDSHGSFCSKLAGIYAILLTLSTILQITGEMMPFQLTCDGKLVLLRLQRVQATDPNEPHADLLSATWHLMKHCGIHINLHHVKGHQDSKNFGPYTRDATLNIEVDKLAWEKLGTQRPGPKTFHIPWSQGVCYMGANQIVKDFATIIWDHINGQSTIEYWTKHRLMSQGIWNKINWVSIGRAMRELPINWQCWVSKYVSGHFATGKNMQWWKFQSSAQCLRCYKTQEDKNHIMTCPAPEACERWEKSMKAIESWLREENTDKIIREQLLSYLRTWNTPSMTLPEPSNPLENQEEIRKQYIWDRWLSQDWQEQQDQTWKWMQSRKSSRQWTSELIKKLWNMAWDMWDQWNKALHESTLNQELILEKDANNQIRQIYAVGPCQLARADLGLMWHPVEHQLQLPLNMKQQWVASIDVALHQKNLHEHGTMLAEQWLMETWVIRNPTCRTPVPISQQRLSHSQGQPWAVA